MPYIRILLNNSVIVETGPYTTFYTIYFSFNRKEHRPCQPIRNSNRVVGITELETGNVKSIIFYGEYLVMYPPNMENTDDLTTGNFILSLP